MSRVEINAGGRQVIVDHEAELAHVADTALSLWEKIDGPQPAPGPAVGFTAELSPQWDHGERPVSIRQPVEDTQPAPGETTDA